jgi:ABC-type branched-subunit amino acid transport system substrate-binding protein
LKKGVEIAVSEINAKGGVKGRLLEIIYEDGKCSNKEASTATQKLISIDKVKGSNPNK